MKQKRKKQVTAAIILVFFLAAGLWYFLWNKRGSEQTEGNNRLTGVLEIAATGVPDISDSKQDNTGLPEEEPEKVVVYVCGAVKEPGIYSLAKASRLYEAVKLAGGFSPEADPSYHNLARSIFDGERIYILSATETKMLTTEQQVGGEEGVAAVVSPGGFPINLNTATKEQLMELPGIGESRAADILAYRKRVGQFTSIEEIMNVSGIGEAMFAKMKEKITVK